MTIELNEQQLGYLKMVVTYQLGDKTLGKTDLAIIKQIYKALKTANKQ